MEKHVKLSLAICTTGTAELGHTEISMTKAAQAVVGSIVWAFPRAQKAKELGDERPRQRAS